MASNVMFVHRGGNQIRGTEECLLALLRNIDRGKICPFVLCTNKVLLESVRKYDIEALLFDLPEIMVDGKDVRLSFLKYAKTIIRLRSLLIRKDIKLVYCSGGHPCQISVPAAKSLKTPVLCHFHHPSPKRYYYLWLVKFADAVIFPSDFTRKHSIKKAGVDGEVMYNGINTWSEFIPAKSKNFYLRRFHGIEDDEIVIGQISTFVPTKGHKDLLMAFKTALAKINNLKLILIGEGPIRKEVQVMAREIGVGDKVIFPGYVDSVADYLQHVIDINVLASSEEGLGIVLLQASACGLPNIGTDCTGIREAIQNNVTGYLFEKGDTNDLAKRIIELARNSQRRSLMGNAGREYVVREFSETRYATKIQEKMLALIKERAGE